MHVQLEGREERKRKALTKSSHQTVDHNPKCPMFELSEEARNG